MLNNLTSELTTKPVKKRLEKYLFPNAGIDIDDKDTDGRTILCDLAVCMDILKLPVGVQNEENTKRQQAIIDIANALLNRGARPDIRDNYGQTPLLYMVSYCIAIYNHNKNGGKNINRAKEIALLQKMLQASHLANTDAKFFGSKESTYKTTQYVRDQEVLDLLTAAGITK
jgi:hypothetical protein